MLVFLMFECIFIHFLFIGWTRPDILNRAVQCECQHGQKRCVAFHWRPIDSTASTRFRICLYFFIHRDGQPSDAHSSCPMSGQAWADRCVAFHVRPIDNVKLINACFLEVWMCFYSFFWFIWLARPQFHRWAVQCPVSVCRGMGSVEYHVRPDQLTALNWSVLVVGYVSLLFYSSW